jgi:site-specific DNA-methyltransferase (adenine-specific)
MTIDLQLGDNLELLKSLSDNSIDSVVTDPPYGISFMGKKWDYNIPKVELWKEVLRVLKPGGHALVACGTKTQHRMAVNLEDAGFEIRDTIAWVYGQGFPKSVNIGKAVDKLEGNEREILGTYGDGSNRKNGPFNTEKGWNSNNLNPSGNLPLTKGNSKYEGWGTALKPAMELWSLVRKPIEEKTIAENVLKHGTGGINIDDCRIGTDIITNNINDFSNQHGNKFGNGMSIVKLGESTTIGRYPSNFIHDGSDEVVDLFPNNQEDNSLARFFYCAKASKSERNNGLDDLNLINRTAAGNNQGSRVCETCGKTDNGSNDHSECNGKFIYKLCQPIKNTHPTIKPVKLMKYLCTMITPKGGICIDPFMGSGTTGIACKALGFDFIGMEHIEEYFNIAENRIKNYKQEEKPKIEHIEEFFEF